LKNLEHKLRDSNLRFFESHLDKDRRRSAERQRQWLDPAVSIIDGSKALAQGDPARLRRTRLTSSAAYVIATGTSVWTI
jgi:hypothetical protein